MGIDSLKQEFKIFLGTFNFIREREWRIIRDWIEFKKNEKVLDAGCGSGVMSMRIGKRGCKVYGIDLNEKMIVNAKRLSLRVGLDCKFQRADLLNLPYKDRVFDKVICNSTLEHLSDDIEALKEINRVLKPDGILMLTVDSFTYPIDKKLKEIHRKECSVLNYYSLSLLRDKLYTTGFEIIKSQYYLNSPLSSLFFRWGIKNNFANLFKFLFPPSYILGLISDRLFGKCNMGYGLAVKIRKPKKDISKKNIVLLTPLLPHLLDSGFGIHFFNYIKILSSKSKITLVSFIDDKIEMNRLENLKPYCLKISVIPKRVLTFKHKVIAFLNLLKGLFTLTPYHVKKFSSKRMYKKIKELLNRESYDFIFVVDIGMAQYIKDQDGPPKVLFELYIKSIFYEEYAKTTRNILMRFLSILEAKKLRRYEDFILKKFDRIITVTQSDADYLKLKSQNSINCEYLPIAIDTNFFIPNEKRSLKKNILLIGGLFWYPNLAQTRWFLKDIFPLIENRIPDVNLIIIGEAPPKSILRYSGRPNISILGYVRDIRPYLKDATVMVVPTRICGGGVRTKILVALASKVAVVSTSIACNGIGLIPRKHLMVVDKEEDFADAVVRVLEDGDLRRQLTINGYKYLLENFSLQRVNQELERLLFDFAK